MAITSANYYIELSVAEGNTKQVFINVDYIFKQVDVLWILTETGWELVASDIFIRIMDGWINILTGSIIYDAVIPLSSYDVVIDTAAYLDILSEDDYDEIQT